MAGGCEYRRRSAAPMLVARVSETHAKAESGAVRAGEIAYGVWCAGDLKPGGLSQCATTTFVGAPLSVRIPIAPLYVLLELNG